MRKPARLVPAVALATVLAVGFAAVLGVLVKWGYSTVRSLRPATVAERVLVVADATPVVERLNLVNGLSQVPRAEKFRDPAGNFVPVPDDAPWSPGVALHGRGSGGGLLGDFLTPAESLEWRLRRLSGPRDPVAWYFVCDGRGHGRAYFVAYDTQHAERVGYLGPAGFRSDPLPPEEQFPFDGSNRGIVFHVLNHNSYYWRFHPIGVDPNPRQPPAPAALYLQADNDTVYQVDLEARLVRVVFAGRTVRATGLLQRSAPAPGVGATSLVVRTDDEVLEFDGRNDLVRRFPVPEDLRERGFLWLVTGSGEFVTITDQEYDFTLHRVLDQITRYDAAGRLLRRDETWTQKQFQGDEFVLGTGSLSP